MDKQVLAVIFSFVLYILYVLVPMIPAIVIYRYFPDTKVSARGILANLNIKTTGAFAAYVVTVVLGFFLVQNTHNLIAQIGNPVWTLKTKVKLQNEDNSTYNNKYLLETLVVTIDPKIQRINKNNVILQLPGSKASLKNTQLTFDIPNFGYKQINLDEAIKNAEIDNYELTIKLTEPISIVADRQKFEKYHPNSDHQRLTPVPTGGPKLKNVGG